MRMKLSYFTPLLAAGAAAVAIAAAPTAMAADPGPGCHMQAGVPVCPNTHSTLVNPPAGNSQINASPGAVGFAPQYPYMGGDYWGGGNSRGHIGGFGGGFGHGGAGGHGGGGGGGHGR
jgi:hypothetical protein